MRRILWVLVLAASTLAASGGSAAASVGSCPTGTSVGGAGVGLDLGPDLDEVRVCVYETPSTGTEVETGVFHFLGIGTTYVGAVEAGGASVCRYTPTSADPDDFTCLYGGGIATALTSTDYTAVFVAPSVCATTDENVWGHCFTLYVTSSVDGPLGRSLRFSTHAAACEQDFGFVCRSVGVDQDVSRQWRLIHDALSMT